MRTIAAICGVTGFSALLLALGELALTQSVHPVPLNETFFLGTLKSALGFWISAAALFYVDRHRGPRS